LVLLREVGDDFGDRNGDDHDDGDDNNACFHAQSIASGRGPAILAGFGCGCRKAAGMICYFLRHGPAEDAAQWRGSDYDRPLTEKGSERMVTLAKRLVKMGLDVDYIVTSPLIRAKQTAEIVAGFLDLRERLMQDPRLAGDFGPAALRDILCERRTANAIVLVGHEPNMSMTIGHAVGGARIDFKKGAIACLDFPDPSTLRGELLWTAPPKILL
jgi:phosphohistidine phosphatase